MRDPSSRGGAFANLLTREGPRKRVVVAASGGNHGLAVAFAANRLQVLSTIFVPEVAAATKQERIRSLGARLMVVGQLYADALAASREFCQGIRRNADPRPSISPKTLLGQGSVGLEAEQQCPELDTLLVSVGGGGLIGGHRCLV